MRNLTIEGKVFFQNNPSITYNYAITNQLNNIQKNNLMEKKKIQK